MDLKNKNCFVVGSGLVGSLWAIYLSRRGARVFVSEKRSDPRASRDEGRSINLVVTSRGVNALKRIDLWNEVSKICVPVTGRMMHSVHGELSYQPYGRDESECNYSVSRLNLNRLLIEHAEAEGVRFFFQNAFEQIDVKKKIVFLESEDFEYDFCFGADGSASTLREELTEQDLCQNRIEMLSHGYKELYIPIGAEGNAVLDAQCLHIWPRGHHMLMALANLDGSFTVTLYLPRQGEMSFDSMRSSGSVRQYFSQYYPDVVDLMPSYEEDFASNPMGRLGTVYCDTWNYDNSLLLIGDASHGIVPFFGQGMNSGFEDCFELDKHFDEGILNFSKFVQQRKTDTDAIARMALENFQEMSDKVGNAEFLLKKQIEHQLETWFPSLYRSRYGMVCYTQIPYAIAKSLGELQDEILKSLCQGVQSADELNQAQCESLLKRRLKPAYDDAGIDLEGKQS